MLNKLYGSVPLAPTNMSATVTSDESLLIAWTNKDPQALIEVYQDSVLIATKSAGTTSHAVSGLTRATNYTYFTKHIRNGVRGPASGSVVGRPIMIASGGTVVTQGGNKYHIFTASDNITLSVTGRVSYRGIGRGGNGGAGFLSGSADHGGGGGAAGAIFVTNDTLEPANTYAIQIGNSSNNGHTTYRSEDAGPGDNGVDATNFVAGDGGSNAMFTGGTGFAAGVGNNGGGGGGAGAAGNGTNGVLSGGAAGAATTAFPVVGSIGAVVGLGGIGGRGTGMGASATTYGSGGDGGNTGGVSGGLGFQGVFVLWYPI